MDISALLSPSEPSASQDSTASPRPGNHGGAKSRNDSPAVRHSPRSQPSSSTPQANLQHRPPMSSPSTSNFSSATMLRSFSAQSYGQTQANATATTEQRPALQRGPPSGMDTLADLASMQQQHHHQNNVRPHPVRQLSGNANGTQQRPRLEDIQRQHSGSRGSIDMSKLDAQKMAPRELRVLRSASLSDAELNEAAQLFEYLADNPHSYQSHVQLTKILRRGLRIHSLDPESNELRQDPRTYELVKELLEANAAMSTRFAIGEDLWQERIQDQQLLVHTVEECHNIMELCQQAVNEEAGSTALWELYGTWTLRMYQASCSIDTDMSASLRRKWESWSQDDVAVAKEVFSRQLLVDTWGRGAQETMNNLDDSHLIWNKYLTLITEDLDRESSDQNIEQVKEILNRRLDTPHKEWDQTFQQFSQFVSRFVTPARYEETMLNTKQRTKSALARYELRSVYESKWRSSKQAHDQVLEWAIVSEYLEWELGQSKKKRKFDFELAKALYQRILLRFPHVTTLWEDYFLFLADESPAHLRERYVLPAIDRGTSHCPWSGTLWGHYIRAGELEQLSFQKMSEIKHRATSKGLLDASSIEEHLLINTNWCSYLRRRAFDQGIVEEDELDVTEVGIRSALEEIEIIGRKREGDAYQGDPQYRLERIYIRFCTQVGDGAHLQTARHVWEKLIPRCGNQYEFWQWYFLWERFIWAKNPQNTNMSPTPRTATEVLIRGINNPELDWPEKLVGDLLRHAEDYEDPDGQLHAIIVARKANKEIEKRRARETAEARQGLLEQQQAVAADSSNLDTPLSNGKRKRDEAEDTHNHMLKKLRPDTEEDTQMTGDYDSNPSQLKRDRENSTIVVRNLPAGFNGRRVRNFFRDCGDIKDIKADREGRTAIIEFENSEDVLAALTRDGKDFEGHAIEVSVGTGLTIWCTNYPAAADETYIRRLFEPYGEIVDIRFPSLKYNTHRRFCYVQFQNAAQAIAATELDGKDIQEGNTQLKLTAKISDPAHKQGRGGALEEGRELYVRDVDWNGTEDELREIFSKYGDVSGVRIPRNMGGKSKGHAFIVFETAEQAQAALELHKTKFKSRFLDVSVAENKAAKRSATTVVRDRVSASPSPSVTTNGQAATTTLSQAGNTELATSREAIAARTIVLLDVPDTVNDARVRAIAEPHGTLTKVTLRPDRGGAVIEYADVASAGKASMALEGIDIIQGRKIRTGTIADLMSGKAEKKDQSLDGGSAAARDKKTKAEAKAPFLPSGVIRRPGQPSGRRGGLGFKRAGAGLGGPRAANPPEKDGKNGDEMDVDATNGEDEQKKPKNNADFKAMFLKGNE